MVRIHPIFIAVIIAIVFPAIAYGEDGPCGGQLELTGGEVVIGKAIPAEAPLSPASRTCLQAIADVVIDRPFIRSITVAARVTDDQRLDGKGLELAKTVATALVEAGVPERKISAVAPAVGHGQDPGVVLVYRERENTERIARILGMSGSVKTGRALALMRRAQSRQDLVTHDYVRTAANSAALIRLADRSTLYLGPSSLLRLGKIGLDENLQRQVRIDLAQGEVIAFAARVRAARYSRSPHAPRSPECGALASASEPMARAPVTADSKPWKAQSRSPTPCRPAARPASPGARRRRSGSIAALARWSSPTQPPPRRGHSSRQRSR